MYVVVKEDLELRSKVAFKKKEKPHRQYTRHKVKTIHIITTLKAQLHQNYDFFYILTVIARPLKLQKTLLNLKVTIWQIHISARSSTFAKKRPNKLCNSSLL